MKIKKFFSRNELLQGDMGIWMAFLLLCMISVVEVYSASSNMSYSTGAFYRPILQHGSYVIIGIVLAWLIHRMPCYLFKLFSLIGMMISILALIFVLFQGQVNGASRWISVGGVTFQPSEFAKLSLVTFVAFILAALRDERGASVLAFKIVAGATAIILSLIVFENASTAGIIFLVMFAMCFYGQVRMKFLIWILVALLSFGTLVTTLVINLPESALTAMSDYEGNNFITKKAAKTLHRVPTWMNRLKGRGERPQDPNDYDVQQNLQVTHAHIAVATSNILGKGPGNSVQRDYLPQAYSDFIYAIIIEESGIIGAVVVMGLYFLLMWRAMRIARKCKSLFPAYLVMGLSLMMVVQAMINMAVAVGAFPVTGQPLPLISKGGTSTFVNCAYIGMMLSVSRSAKKKEDTPAKASSQKAVAGEKLKHREE